jgi:hypothetical protein
VLNVYTNGSGILLFVLSKWKKYDTNTCDDKLVSIIGPGWQTPSKPNECHKIMTTGRNVT